MTNHSATLLLTHVPTPERIEELARYTAEEYFPDAEYTYTLADEFPKDLPTDVADQLASQKRDTPGSVYLIIRPS